MDKCQKHYAKESDRKGHILYDSFYMIYSEWVNPDKNWVQGYKETEGKGGMKSDHLKDMGCFYGVMKKLWN